MEDSDARSIPTWSTKSGSCVRDCSDGLHADPRFQASPEGVKWLHRSTESESSQTALQANPRTLGVSTLCTWKAHMTLVLPHAQATFLRQDAFASLQTLRAGP